MSGTAVGRVAVVGAGTMGLGIGHVSALAGFDTVLVDVDPESLSRALARIRGNLETGVERGKVTAEDRDDALGRLRSTTDLESAASTADCVIEAAPESLALKQELFRRIDAASPPEALLATNTSSLPIAEIAAATRDPRRVLGMHFFNPVHIMPLLEIVRGAATAEAAVERARRMGERMGKECIVVRDSPGFATSRLGVALGLEAIRMLEENVASVEDIDKAMTLGYRHPMGPLRLTDLVGLDVRLAIADHLLRALGSEVFRPPDLLRRLVAEGKLGQKSGRGFYLWP